MGKSDFFSFGDEDLGSEVAESWADSSSPQSATALAVETPGEDLEEPLRSMPEGLEPLEAEGPARDGKGAERSRGDSAVGSSAKRKPPSRRVQGVVLLAVLGVVIAIASVVIAPRGTESQLAVSPPTQSVANDPESPSRSSGRAGPGKAPSQKGRQRAAEREQAQKKKAQTRRRARRGRAPRQGDRQRLKQRSAPKPAPSPPVETPQPAPEAPAEEQSLEAEAPPPAAEPATSDSSAEAPIQDGSTSSEFGL